MRIIAWGMFVALLAPVVAFAEGLPRTPAGAELQVQVQFGLKGMGVAPTGIAAENTGHHHLLIDPKKIISATETHGRH